MASRYPNAIFFKVDIQSCPLAAQTQSVTATPTFILFKNKVRKFKFELKSQIVFETNSPFFSYITV